MGETTVSRSIHGPQGPLEVGDRFDTGAAFTRMPMTILLLTYDERA